MCSLPLSGLCLHISYKGPCHSAWTAIREEKRVRRPLSEAMCLHRWEMLSPRTPMLTVAGGSVILARSPGPCEVVWSGLVRGLDQSSCLAELLAITDALVSFFLCHCFLWYFSGGEVCHETPASTTERKTFGGTFARTREREWGNYIVRWVRAHQDVATLILAMQGSWLPSTATLMLRCVKWWLRMRVMRCIKVVHVLSCR